MSLLVRFFAIFSLLTFSTLVCVGVWARGSKPKIGAPSAEFVQNQLLVAFKTHLSAKKRLAIWQKHGLKEIEQVGSSPLFLTENTKPEKPLDTLITELKKEVSIKYAEKNMRMKIFQDKKLTN